MSRKFGGNITMLAATADHQKLLLSLKATVEGLLGHQVANVWSIYGGLNRLLWAVEKIFRNGCKIKNNEGGVNFWPFINGLSWLQPQLSQHLSETRDNTPNLPEEIHNNKAMIWIYLSLKEHSLSEKLHWLLSDSKHLINFYDESAFLCQEKYVNGMFLCLKAVEQNQPFLLLELDPSLYIMDYGKFQRNHRRCSSLPESKTKFFQNLDDRKILDKDLDLEMPVFSSGTEKVSTGISLIEETIPEKSECNKVTNTRRCASLPNLTCELFKSDRVRTKSVSKLSPSVLKVDYNKVSRACDKYRTEAREKTEICVEEKKNNRCKVKKRNQRKEVKEWFVVQGEKEERKKTFMEDGGTSVLPMSTGYFPRPMQGQSLTSFLTSELFSRASAELDRENAHFSISEAMISAIEQMKCNRQLRLIENVNEDESDEELNRLKQRIRLRRRQRLEEKNVKQQLWSSSLLSDGRTDTTTTDQSVSPLSTTPETPSESISTDDVDDFEVDEGNNLKKLKNSELSVSMASLYSEADLSKTRRDTVEPMASAENVALSLLKQFKEKQLPRASDLEWLVSEEDAPQELLPLPKSWPVSPDDAECGKATLLRGTLDWAPPRAQVIFTLHPSPVRRVLLHKQNFRCAGCGLRVAHEYAHKFRYCEYLGRYFCTGCHSNQLAIIPGRILFKWDFNRYPVSTFSYRLLDQMLTDPLFRINDLNPELYKRTKALEKVRQLRLQLYYIKDFVLTCRFAFQIRDDLEREAKYLLNDPDMYSTQDLIQVKTGELRERLRDLVKDCFCHIDNCQLCQARGFVCELCPSKDVIFPWLINKVSRCTNCGSCFHTQCFKSGFCPRCARVNARKQNQTASVF